MLRRFVGSFGDDRHTEPATDSTGDISERHSFVANPMIPRAGRTLLDDEPIEVRRIEPVHGGPTIVALVHVRRRVLVTGDADERRHEPMITIAMYRGRQSHNGYVHAARSQCVSGLLGRNAGQCGSWCVVLRRGPPGRGDEARAGGDNEWPV